MVSTAGRQLSAQHRRQQVAIRAAAARDVVQVWEAGFDLSDIDRSWRRMEPAMVAVTSDYRRQSANVASGYFQAFRTAEDAPGGFRPRLAVPPSREVLRYSLGYYGMVVPNQLYRSGRTDVARQAAVQLVGGVSRHVNDGGRHTVLENVGQDRQARGWQRITAGRPCSFCAMIAARGAVFSADTATFQAHDHCQCTAEPVYGRDDSRPEQARQWSQLWNESTRGVSGARAQRNAFRRAYEAAE
jgi:hypothetical protein